MKTFKTYNFELLARNIEKANECINRFACYGDIFERTGVYSTDKAVVFYMHYGRNNRDYTIVIGQELNFFRITALRGIESGIDSLADCEGKDQYYSTAYGGDESCHEQIMNSIIGYLVDDRYNIKQ